MEKKLLGIRIVLLSVVLLMIGCIAAPAEVSAAAKKPGQVKKISVKAKDCRSIKIS